MSVELVERRITLDEWERMVEAGVFDEDERIELLGGRIVCMAPIGIRHRASTSALYEFFLPRLLGRAIVYSQQPVGIPPDAEVEPDLLIVRYRTDQYRTRHPRPEDVLLIVEVADSSLSIDTSAKLPRYAEAGIPEAWLFDLRGDRALVYCEPQNGTYSLVRIVERGGTLSPIAFPDLVLQANDILWPGGESE